MRARHSELEDGGSGALAVGVTDDVRGAIIQVVATEPVVAAQGVQMVHPYQARAWQEFGKCMAEHATAQHSMLLHCVAWYGTACTESKQIVARRKKEVLGFFRFFAHFGKFRNLGNLR